MPMPFGIITRFCDMVYKVCGILSSQIATLELLASIYGQSMEGALICFYMLQLLRVTRLAVNLEGNQPHRI